MRPAYVTRCPVCLRRVELEDKLQEDKVKGEDGKIRTVFWFDPDRMLRKACCK